MTWINRRSFNNPIRHWSQAIVGQLESGTRAWVPIGSADS